MLPKTPSLKDVCCVLVGKSKANLMCSGTPRPAALSPSHMPSPVRRRVTVDTAHLIGLYALTRQALAVEEKVFAVRAVAGFVTAAD